MFDKIEKRLQSGQISLFDHSYLLFNSIIINVMLT